MTLKLYFTDYHTPAENCDLTVILEISEYSKLPLNQRKQVHAQMLFRMGCALNNSSWVDVTGGFSHLTVPE